jgi:MFS transporter, SP family, xylose:H+ symportor
VFTAGSSEVASTYEGELRIGYLWMIAFVAALGGLLFGYDWVVIGGAKPFYESYFGLTSQWQIGWANSCALIGCFVGSLIAGFTSERMGRRNVLVLSALIFAISSVLTGWSHSFASFIAWRIAGGAAIGLASSISPMYIAEISPAAWRGRLVSLNQLAIVCGILLAQIANWRIADKIPPHLSALAMAATWNVQFGWRWMFTAVAVPALLLLISAPLIPESPRWLAAHDRLPQAAAVLSRIGGEQYSQAELQSIRQSLASPGDQSHWRELFRSPARKLVIIGIALAVLQQGSGINILFNYAEEVYQSAGYGLNDILFNIVITGAINLVFTLLAMLLVDRFGRRRLMIFGCVSIALSHIAASLAYHAHLQGKWVLMLTLCAIACYAVSLAPVTWVLISEIFPNRIRAAAVSTTVAFLWIASFVLTYSFPMIDQALGTSGAFLIYGSICVAGAFLIVFAVPETKGRSLEQIESAGI